MTTTLHIRMPAKLKKDAQKIAKRNGIDLPTVVRIFFTHMVDKGTVPMTWLTVNGMTVQAEQALSEQVRHPDIVGTMRSKKEVDRFIDDL